MKKIIGISALGMLLFSTSCGLSSGGAKTDKDSLTSDSLSKLTDSTAKAASDSVTAAGKGADSSLRSLGDSIKADLKDAAHKVKEGSEALGDKAKEKATQGIDAVKDGAKKVGNAAKAGYEAGKDALKNKVIFLFSVWHPAYYGWMFSFGTDFDPPGC